MNSARTPKTNVQDFAFFGGKPLFESIRSISNLVKPNFDRFLKYSQPIFEDHLYSANGQVELLLESRLAEFHNVSHCVSFCGGFWGLVLAMKSLAIENRTEIVMPSLTYRRLADIVAWAGYVPHFCEVDPIRLCITATTARQSINEKTALILGVHPIVNCCDSEALEILSAETGIPLLFDAVESSYETFKGRRVGSFGKAECFSMQSSKLLNAFEGGYVTTNDEHLARRLRRMRNLGVDEDGTVDALGMNARQNEIHAAMALAALDDVDQQVETNRRRYECYKAGLSMVSGLRLVTFDESERNGYKNIVVELLDTWPLSREFTLELLHGEKMLCRPYYHPPLHQKVTGYSMVWSDLSKTEELAEKFLLLPCGYFVSEDDVRSICECLGGLQANGTAIAKRAMRHG